MTLDTLLARAGVCNLHRHSWFSNARLVLDSLMVSDIDDHDCIARCFLPQLREVHPALVLTFAPSLEPREKASAPRQSAFKKSYDGRIVETPKQGDML